MKGEHEKEDEEQKRAQEAPEGERRAQEEQEREAKTQEEEGWQVRETEALEGQERKANAQEEHEEEVEGTTREGSVEERKETNSMQQENEVSNRHMTWGRNAWWIRGNNGPHMRTARGRRRTWRAARRAAEQALMTTGSKRPRVMPKRYRERNGEEKKGERQTTQCNANTLHLVIRLPTTTTPTTPTSAAAAAMRQQ